MTEQGAFAIPCNLIIQADTDEDASKRALEILKFVLDFESDVIGFDHDDEVEANK